MILYFNTQSQIEQMSRALGECITGARLSVLFHYYNFVDDKTVSTKWKRIYNTFIHQINKKNDQQPIFDFIQKILSPVNYKDKPKKFSTDCENINKILRFIGFEINEKGRIIPIKKAETLTEARIRANNLKKILEQRNVHRILFSFCTEELCNNDYFHAGQEAIKSILFRLRDLTGLRTDGRALIQQVLQKENPIIINKYQTLSEKNEHEGVFLICESLVSMIRNPTAHEPKIHWTITEQDALETISMISYVHRKLDNAQRIRLI